MALSYNNFMKILSKFAVVFPLAAILVCILFLTLALTCGVAFADNFDTEYPTDEFFPVDRAQYVAAGEYHIAVFDSAKSNIVVKGTAVGAKSFHLSLADKSDVSGIWIAGTTLLIEYGNDTKQYCKVDMAASAPELVPATLDTPANISYITSDSRYFYAKSDLALTVYNSNLTPVKENVTDEAVKGTNVFASDNMTLYIFSSYYGSREYIVYNVNEGTSSLSVPTLFSPYRVTNAGEYMFIGENSEIYAIRKSDGTALDIPAVKCAFKSPFASYGNKLYVPNDNGGVDVYTYDFQALTVELTETLAMSGDGDGMLDTPTDVIFHEDSMIIADSANNRIAYVKNGETSYISIDGDSPVKLTASSKGLYVASAHAVYSVESSVATKLLNVTAEVRDILSLGEFLYVLTSDSLNVLVGGTLMPVATLSEAVAMTNAEDSGIIYVMSRTGIYTLTSDGKEKLPFRACDFSAATDIAVDYAGNLYAVYPESDKIVSYKNMPSSVTEDTVTNLDSDILSPAPVSLTLQGSYAYFASESCFVGKIDVGAVDKDSFQPVPAPVLGDSPAMEFASVTADTYMFGQPDRFDTLSALAAQTKVLVFKDASTVEGYTHIYSQGQFGYVETTALQAAEPTPVNEKYVLKAGAPLTAYPMCETTLAMSENVTLTLLDGAAGLDNNTWARVEYDGKTYFAKRADLEKYVEIVPEKEKVYCRAVADRAGGVVNIYSLPDSTSDVVVEVVDGTRMEILEENGDYYYITVDGVSGYVLKNQVKLEGLTTVQIVSIVLAVLVMVAGSVIFAVTYYTRKKEKE